MTLSPTIVYVVDDDARFREGLELLCQEVSLQSQSFDSGQAFLAALPQLRPGCLFVDLAMPGMGGLDLLRQLRAAGCRWPVVILTAHGNPMNAEDAMRAGAFAFLEKPARDYEVLAIASRARAYLQRDTQMAQDDEIAQRIERLSRREREVFDGVLRGQLNKQIAAQLGVSESTIKSARRALMDRMQAETSKELIAMAIRAGLTIKNR